MFAYTEITLDRVVSKADKNGEFTHYLKSISIGITSVRNSSDLESYSAILQLYSVEKVGAWSSIENCDRSQRALLCGAHI